MNPSDATVHTVRLMKGGVLTVQVTECVMANSEQAVGFHGGDLVLIS
jgi:hypothetical protein